MNEPQPRLRIGFNGRFLLHPYTGIGQYTLNLLLAMAKLDPSIEWVIGVPDKTAADKILTEHLKGSVPPSLSLLPTTDYRLPAFPLSLHNFFWEQVQLPRALKKANVDLIHYPYPANPRFPGCGRPGAKPPKTVVTVHDVIPWSRPEYRKKLRTRLVQRNAQRALQNADAIIAVSEATALDLTDKIHFPYDHVKVIHEAASPVFTPEGRRHAHKRDPLKTTDYFLYVGGYDPRKNVTRLVEAFNEYIAPHHDIDLILVGGETAMQELAKGTNRLLEPLPASTIKDPQQTLAQRESRSRILLTPSLSPETLAEYYRGARALINVSLAEGFNLPLLEAAACGTPILTSDLTIHREILSIDSKNHEESALFCDPTSTKSIGEMMINFLRDDSLEQKLRAATAALRDTYTWEKAAEKTIDLYKSLLS